MTDAQTGRTGRSGLGDGGKHYFLSRPRRFGKSLFLDTLKELFEGSQKLFEGLSIHRKWDWSARSPVVRLDFSQGDFTAPGYLHRNAMAQLVDRGYADKYRAPGVRVHLVGVEFSSASRNVVAFEHAPQA